MSAKHSPAPWRAGGSVSTFLVYASDGSVVAEYFGEADGELIVRAPDLDAEVDRLKAQATEDLNALVFIRKQYDEAVAQRDALLEATKRIVRMEQGDYEPGDIVEMMDGHHTYWTAEIVRVNEATYTVVRRADGKTRRWEKDGVYPHSSMWDAARAAIKGDGAS